MYVCHNVTFLIAPPLSHKKREVHMQILNFHTHQRINTFDLSLFFSLCFSISLCSLFLMSLKCLFLLNSTLLEQLGVLSSVILQHNCKNLFTIWTTYWVDKQSSRRSFPVIIFTLVLLKASQKESSSYERFPRIIT